MFLTVIIEPNKRYIQRCHIFIKESILALGSQSLIWNETRSRLEIANWPTCENERRMKIQMSPSQAIPRCKTRRIKYIQTGSRRGWDSNLIAMHLNFLSSSFNFAPFNCELHSKYVERAQIDTCGEGKNTFSLLLSKSEKLLSNNKNAHASFLILVPPTEFRVAQLSQHSTNATEKIHMVTHSFCADEQN